MKCYASGFSDTTWEMVGNLWFRKFSSSLSLTVSNHFVFTEQARLELRSLINSSVFF